GARSPTTCSRLWAPVRCCSCAASPTWPSSTWRGRGCSRRPSERRRAGRCGMPEAMTEADVRRALEGLPGWTDAGGALRKELRFDGFPAAFAFLTRVALLAERMGHHPGGGPARAVELARAIEGLLGRPPAASTA